MNNLEKITKKWDAGTWIVICFVILSIILIIISETRFHRIPIDIRQQANADLAPRGKTMTFEEAKIKANADLAPRGKTMTFEEAKIKANADLAPKVKSN